MSTRAIIVEDELLLRHQIEDMLAEVWPQLQVLDSVGDGSSGMAAFEQHRPDLLFLDVEMPGMSGLELARRVGGRCHIVFITAYGQHAVAAFDAGAVDYVLKPIDTERLALACARVRERLAGPPQPLQHVLDQLAARIGQAQSHLRWITAARGAAIRLITVEQVCYFQADTKYTRVACADGESLIHTPLRELLEQLDPAMFWQVHRSTIVNAMAVDSVVRDGDGRLLLRVKGRPETLRVSQTFASRFRQM